VRSQGTKVLKLRTRFEELRAQVQDLRRLALLLLFSLQTQEFQATSLTILSLQQGRLATEKCAVRSLVRGAQSSDPALELLDSGCQLSSSVTVQHKDTPVELIVLYRLENFALHPRKVPRAVSSGPVEASPSLRSRNPYTCIGDFTVSAGDVQPPHEARRRGTPGDSSFRLDS